VLPSIIEPDGKMEGIPVALMEALAAGVPTVATRLSASRARHRRRTGYVVPPADAESLAAAIARALSEPRGRARWRRRGVHGWRKSSRSEAA